MEQSTLQHMLLQHALPLVSFEGWTEAMLRHAAEEAGLAETEVIRAFPGGVVEAVDCFTREADHRMIEAIQALNLSSMKIRERIAESVWLRLEQNMPHREVIRRACAFYALPQHAPHALKSLYHTVDDIWYAIGDTSTDFNFYTKRLLLAGVYSSTLMHWLNDDSPGQEATRAFLYRRIADVMQIQKARLRLKEVLSG